MSADDRYKLPHGQDWPEENRAEARRISRLIDQLAALPWVEQDNGNYLLNTSDLTGPSRHNTLEALEKAKFLELVSSGTHEGEYAAEAAVLDKIRDKREMSVPAGWAL